LCLPQPLCGLTPYSSTARWCRASTQEQVAWCRGCSIGPRRVRWLRDRSRLAVSTVVPRPAFASALWLQPRAAHFPLVIFLSWSGLKGPVYSITVEEWQPGLTNPLVAAVAALRVAHCVLIHLYYDPVDALVCSAAARVSASQRFCAPALISHECSEVPVSIGALPVLCAGVSARDRKERATVL